MEVYRSYKELFEDNIEYFDSNEKKAWFILGRAYNTIIYNIRKTLKGDEEENSADSIKTSLEKNFFFARKFDFNDFIYFSNLYFLLLRTFSCPVLLNLFKNLPKNC